MLRLAKDREKARHGGFGDIPYAAMMAVHTTLKQQTTVTIIYQSLLLQNCLHHPLYMC